MRPHDVLNSAALNSAALNSAALNSGAPHSGALNFVAPGGRRAERP
jgi:hypothetical protein